MTINASCRGDDDLPIRIKHETVRCKVDGVAWEAYDYRNEDNLFYDAPFDLLYYSDTKSITLRASRKTADQLVRQSFNIKAKPLSNIGISTKIILRGNEFWDNNKECIRHQLDTTKNRTITLLSIDTIDQYIIGEFEFSVFNDCGDKVHITDGYFDLNYRF